MKKLKSRLSKIYLVCFTLIMVSFGLTSDEKIKGWFLAGSTPEFYEIGIEDNSDSGNKVAYLKSTKDKIENGFGTIMQSFEPTDFLSKKIKLTGRIKSSNVENWSGMWMRIDGNKNGKRKILGFDNMQDRPIKNNTKWTNYEIVLDVPKEAKNISYGVLINGTGEVFIDGFKFQIVSDNTESTGNMIKLTKPTNINFEESN